MKKIRLVLAALAAAAAGAAQAQVSVGVGLNINAPGVYGRVDIGAPGVVGYAPPPVVYEQPVIVAPTAVAVHQRPIYMYVPEAYQRDWRHHCAAYGACGQPVYFVREQWVHDRYVQHYPHDHRYDHWDREHGGWERGHEHDDHGRDFHDHDDHGHGHDDHGHDDHGHGRDHDRR